MGSSDAWAVRKTGRTRMGVPRAMHLVPGKSAIPVGVRNVPADRTYQEIFEDEKEILDSPPTAAEIDTLYGDRTFRYLMIRMAVLHNMSADRIMSCPLDQVPDIRGEVKGIRSALGLAGLLLDEARNRERGDAVSIEEPRGPNDFDDFGEDDGLAGDKGKE